MYTEWLLGGEDNRNNCDRGSYYVPVEWGRICWRSTLFITISLAPGRHSLDAVYVGGWNSTCSWSKREMEIYAVYSRGGISQSSPLHPLRHSILQWPSVRHFADELLLQVSAANKVLFQFWNTCTSTAKGGMISKLSPYMIALLSGRQIILEWNQNTWNERRSVMLFFGYLTEYLCNEDVLTSIERNQWPIKRNKLCASYPE